MFSFFRVFAGFAVVALGVVAQGQSDETQTPFALQSPGQLVQCENTTIIWQGGQSPFKISLKPMCDAGKNASEEVHTVLVAGSTSLELPINFPASTSLIVSITDNTNMQAAAPESIVASGDADDSCAIQPACTDPVRVSSAPVALPEMSSLPPTPAIPTDHLVTADPSATSAQIGLPSGSSNGSSMITLYSYVSQTSTTSTSTPSSSSQANAAIPKRAGPTFIVLECTALVGVNLAFGLW